MQQASLLEGGVASPVTGVSQTVPTICRLCPAHCGVLATGIPRMGNIPVNVTSGRS